ncbi:MAG TPA: hypothetical protein VJN96_27100 [Vicinamibacterales bacterium]|nr:hypothetical protein [Vicinamibacterales bacterium]
MERIEGRVAFLEGTIEEHRNMIKALHETAARLDLRMQSLEERMDRRFEQVDRRFDNLDSKMSRQFTWLVGLQVTSLVAIAGAIFGLMQAVLNR